MVDIIRDFFWQGIVITGFDIMSLFILLFYLFFKLERADGNSPITVKELDLSHYTGKWFQVYTNLYVSQTQVPSCMCVTVNYDQKSNNSLLSTTHCRLNNPRGDGLVVKAQIMRPNIALPGVMELSTEGAPYPTPYMVINLGPVDSNTNQYDYAVVTDANQGALFIYARDIHNFETKYKHGVLDFCSDNGFNSYYNQPRKTPQPASCKYANE